MIQPDLFTQRLLLRRFKLTDANQVQWLLRNESVSKMTINIPFPFEREMAVEWIVSHQEQWEKMSRITYAIVKQDTTILLGAISLVRIKVSEGELGFWLGEPYWDMGYCTEAVKELIDFSYENLGIDRIVANHLPSNPASGRVMEKAGMAYIMTAVKRDKHGNQKSVKVYEISKSECRK